MDAKQLGTFIAERRKELGFTQAQLAEKIHMTDKAVSRWERGVGLPDITSLEPLANALEVSLVQLLQTKSNFTETIKTNDAERLLVTTIQLSKRSNSLTKVFGGSVLCVFFVVAFFLTIAMVIDWPAMVYPVCSIVAGLIAFGGPIWKLSFSVKISSATVSVISLGFALVSVAVQVFSIANEVRTNDWWALIDTMDALAVVIVLFAAISVSLNVVMLWCKEGKRAAK